MAVSYEAILEKMTQALAKAKESQRDQQAFPQYIAKIHVLCQLILEEQEQEKRTETLAHSLQKEKKVEYLQEEANGDSIFDF